MKKIVKLAVLISSLLVFSIANAAPKNTDKNNAVAVTKALADSAKRSLLGDKGKFPLTVEAGYEVTNISANINNVVFEYKMPSDSQNTPLDDFMENVRLGLNSQFCDKPDVVNVLKTYDIRFIFRFQFTDNRNIPTTLSIKEICELE